MAGPQQGVMTERAGRPPARGAQYRHAGEPGVPYGSGGRQPRSQRPAPGCLCSAGSHESAAEALSCYRTR